MLHFMFKYPGFFTDIVFISIKLLKETSAMERQIMGHLETIVLELEKIHVILMDDSQ